MHNEIQENWQTDAEAICEIEERFNEAWGRHDADAMVASLIPDAQVVTANGVWTKTRGGARPDDSAARA